jgi:hypothetical protein
MSKRKELDEQTRGGIKKRLGQLIRRDFTSRPKFERAMEGRVPGSTIRGWFRKEPVVPDGHTLMLLASHPKCRWSPTYILLGKAPEYLSSNVPSVVALETQLRDHIVDATKRAFSATGLQAAFIERATPTAETLLAEVVASYETKLKAGSFVEWLLSERTRSRAVKRWLAPTEAPQAPPAPVTITDALMRMLLPVPPDNRPVMLPLGGEPQSRERRLTDLSRARPPGLRE